jgi:hypothetical protein
VYVLFIATGAAAPTTETTMTINVTWTHGGSFANTDDTARAKSAARAALEAAGVWDAEAAFLAYRAAMMADRELTGYASAWRDAEAAANVAATEGWHDPDGAAVEISA